MPIDGIHEEEVLDLLRNLFRGQETSPLLHQLAKHAERPTLLHFSQTTKYRKLVISHAHFDFVRLDGVIGADGDKLSRGDSMEEAKES